MAAPKKRVVTKKRAAPVDVGAAEFTIVLESIHAQNRAFGEALQGVREGLEGLGERVERLDERLERLDARVTAGFAQVDARFAQVDARFAQVDQRFEQIDRRFERVEGDIVLLKAATLENTRDIKGVQATVSRIEITLERKVDRNEVVEIVEHAVERALARR